VPVAPPCRTSWRDHIPLNQGGVKSGEDHIERPHQGLGGKVIQPADCHDAHGPLVKRERLGGLLNYYCREAA